MAQTIHIIADAGGTSTDWAFVDRDGTPRFHKSDGYNAVSSPPEKLSAILRDPRLQRDGVANVEFYGAGCTPENIPHVTDTLQRHFPGARITVGSDMLGAARALLDDREGIACILGTGSNSCRYDGREIVANVSPLGFILGDEGSGAALGKRLLNLIFKGLADDNLIRDFESEFPRLTRGEVIERVYRRPGAPTFLASLCPFIRSHLDHPQMRTMVRDEFRSFFRVNISQYSPSCPGMPVHFVGSLARWFDAPLREAAADEGFTVGDILPAPIAALARRAALRLNVTDLSVER